MLLLYKFNHNYHNCIATTFEKSKNYYTQIVCFINGWGCGQKVGQDKKIIRRIIILYAYEEKIRVLQTYDEIGSVLETIGKLGYPKLQTLYTWLHECNLPAKIRLNIREYPGLSQILCN